MVLPEWMEDVTVVHQQPHGSRKTLPDRAVDPPLIVECDHPAEKVGEGGALARLDCLEFDFVGVCGVKCYPQEYKTNIGICSAGLSASDLANGAMDAQAHCLGESFAGCTLLGLEFCMGDACLGRHSALFPLSHGRASKSLLQWFSTKVRNPSGAMTSTASPH